MSTLLQIIWLHFIADFVLQTDKMAMNKSSSIRWLGEHVVVYSMPFMVIGGWKYAVVNGAAHFIVDFITSRLSSYFWKKQDRHSFFVVIGADQAIHITVLFLTMGLMT